jgi:hypothetical protein
MLTRRVNLRPRAVTSRSARLLATRPMAALKAAVKAKADDPGKLGDWCATGGRAGRVGGMR